MTNRQIWSAKGVSMAHDDWGVDAEAAYVLSLAAAMGWAAPAGMGLTPLPYAEIAAYGKALGVELAPWEMQAAREISEGFVAGAGDPRKDVDPAWWPELDGMLIPFTPLKGMKVVQDEDGLWKESPADD